MALRAVFLDAGGVLVNPNWVRVSETLARHGVAADPVRLETAEAHAKRDLDVGERIRTTNDRSRGWEYFNLALGHAGIPRTDATDAALGELYDYHQQHNLWETVPAGVPDALAGIRRLGVKLAVVSNSNGTLRAKLARLGLDAAFDLMIDSCEVGVEKPDPGIFTLALDRLGVAAADALHVGDFYNIDVVGARAAGVDAWLIDAGGLYTDADCPRFPDLAAVADALARASRH